MSTPVQPHIPGLSRADRKPRPQPTSEYFEQCALFRFLALWEREYPQLRWIHAIPNGLYLTKGTAAKAVAQGVKSGVWDIFVPVPGGVIYNGMYVEMKAGRNTLTPEQKEFRDFAASHGYATVVCRSWIEAAERIFAYLDITDPRIWDALSLNTKGGLAP